MYTLLLKNHKSTKTAFLRVSAGSNWQGGVAQVYKETLDIGSVRIGIDEIQRKVINVFINKTSLAGKISASNGIGIYLKIGNNIYITNCNVNDKSSWKNCQAADDEVASLNTKFVGSYSYNNEDETSNYKFLLSGNNLDELVLDDVADTIVPKVYLDNAEWDFSDIEPKVKKNKYSYSFKKDGQILFLTLDFKKGKWSFKAIEKGSTIGAKVAKDKTVRFVLSLVSQDETYNLINAIDVNLKTTLSYTK